MAAPTTDQKKAAGNLGVLSGYNAQTVKNQYGQADKNFDLADQQNRQLAEVQYDQNSQKAAGERFAQAKKLQSSTSGVLAAAGNALQGSGARNLIDMLRTRTDLDTGEVLGTLMTNQNAVRNALDESLNANVLARNDAASSAEKSLRDLEADMASQLNNINPNLFVTPGTGKTNLDGAGFAGRNQTPAHVAAMSGYILPAPSGGPTADGQPGWTQPVGQPEPGPGVIVPRTPRNQTRDPRTGLVVDGEARDRWLDYISRLRELAGSGLFGRRTQ